MKLPTQVNTGTWHLPIQVKIHDSYQTQVNTQQLPYIGKYMTATLHINALLNKLHLFYTYSKITLPPGT